ncbi:MAG TPA: matrixin family metalloprotease [Thermoanaerobaculia bacterium]|nr:matrixin family metalloprotease [Thermoanaerobaculia bacterium]
MFCRVPAVILAISLTSFAALGATRMTYDIKGAATPIEWAPTSFPLNYEVDSRVAQLSPNAVAMVDRAFATWAAIPDANLRFENRGVAAGLNSTDHSDRVVISVADDLLRGQGAVALTAYTYDTETGHMLDADIRIDPSLFDGRVNAQQALAHEVGHVLGLDHSAVISATMYPYVGSDGIPSELDSDDRIAMAAMYPRSDPAMFGATLQGRVTGDQGGIFAAQVVAVNEDGQPVGTVLTTATGDFTISGIPPGRYQLYAEPLDGPVVVDSLQGTWRSARGAPFPTEFFGPPIDVESGKVYGNLLVNAAGAVTLNPKLIGAGPAGTTEVSLTTKPISVKPGETVRLTIAGDGFTSGMTTFDVLNPAFQRIGDYEWWGGAVSATYVIAPGIRGSSAVILVKSGRESATLTGALRVYRAPKTRSVRQ